MSAPQHNYSDMTLGQFIHKARVARGMSLEELGAPELSEHYIDALERGAVVPSRMALDILARHFVVPLTELLQVEARLEAEPDLEAIEEDLHLQLKYAQSQLDKRKLEEVLQLVNDAEQYALPYIDDLSWRAHYRIFYLRGTAFLQSGRQAEAQRQIEAAIRYVGPDPDATTRIHNLLGIAHYLQGHLQEALEEHQKGLRAAEDGMIKDLMLKVSTYRNLANTHWGLSNLPEALRFYKEALHLLQDLNEVGRQAAVYWGMMMVYRAMGERAQAKLCGLRSLEIYEVGTDTTATASVCQNLAEMNIEDGQYDDAQRLLERSRELLHGTNELPLLSVLYQDFANLASAQGQFDQAAEYAAQAVEFGAASCNMVPNHDMQTIGGALRSYAEALHIAARIEEARHNRDAAERLFRKAISTIEQTNYEETRSQIIFSYAAALSNWGEHQKSGEYYRLGFRSRQGSRSLRLTAR